jgi:hypothetical protein
MGTIFARIFESRLSRTGPAVVSELRRMGCARALRERGVPGVRQSGDLLLRALKNGVFFLRGRGKCSRPDSTDGLMTVAIVDRRLDGQMTKNMKS